MWVEHLSLQKKRDSKTKVTGINIKTNENYRKNIKED